MPGNENIDTEDLDLLSDALEDEGKDDAALWSEFDQEDAAADTGQPGGHDDGAPVDAEPAAAEPEGTNEGDGAADLRAGSDDAPPAGEGQSAKPADNAQEPDIWASAPPELRAAHEAALQELESRDRRLRGQVSALQRQYNELRAKLVDPKKAEGVAPSADGGEGGFLESKDWKSFADEYPDVAGPIGSAIQALSDRNARLERELSVLGTERRQTQLVEQEQMLAQEHPDWRDVTAQAGPAFVEWLNTQPRHIQDAAHRNANEIVDAAEAADVIGRFKQHLGLTDRVPQPQGQGKEPSRLQGRRQRQLETAAAARSRGPGAASGIPQDGDPETLWRQFDEMERRQARA